MAKKYRVVHCGTGVTGKEALGAIISRPEFELVGLYVNSPDKIGKDAGTFCGMPNTGVKAVKDWDALLALKPDVLSYFADGVFRELEAVADMARFLERGVNVVASSLMPMVSHRHAPPQYAEPLRAAAERGRATFFAGGLDPGLATCHLASTLLSGVNKVRSIRSWEVHDYSNYNVEAMMRYGMGFGMPVDYAAGIFAPGVLVDIWGPQIKLLGSLIGRVPDDVRMIRETKLAHRDIQASWGEVKKGTVGAIRFEIQGLVEKRPFIVVEHITRIGMDMAPEWRHPGPGYEVCYFIDIDADPKMHCRLDFGSGDTMRSTLIATAMHMINAIPAVCAAAPGLTSFADLPVYTTTFARPG